MGPHWVYWIFFSMFISSIYHSKFWSNLHIIFLPGPIYFKNAGRILPVVPSTEAMLDIEYILFYGFFVYSGAWTHDFNMVGKYPTTPQAHLMQHL
jgi:hypothetical protein